MREHIHALEDVIHDLIIKYCQDNNLEINTYGEEQGVYKNNLGMLKVFLEIESKSGQIPSAEDSPTHIQSGNNE